MPQPPELYHEALADFKERRFTEGAEKLLQVIRKFPDLEDAYEALAVIYYNDKRYDEAIRILKKWCQINHDAVMAHTNLSRCYVAKGMIAEAEHEQAEARRLSWKAELKAKKVEQPKTDYKKQIDRFKQVIEFDPADVLGYYSLGSAYLDAGMKREAADTFEKAVEVDPGHSASYLGFGMALQDLGDKEKAQKIYRRGIEVAEKKGDIVPLRKMEARLKSLA